MANNGDEKRKPPLIGLLAVKNQLITKDELSAAMVACSLAEDPESALKEYLVKHEMISTLNVERLEKAAKAFLIRQSELQFGAMAVRKGFVNQSVMNLALEEQEQDIKNKRKVRMLGDILVDAGLMIPKHRDHILELQNRVRQESKEMGVPDPVEETASQPASASETKPSESDPGIENPPEAAPVPEPVPDEPASLMEPEAIEGGITLEISTDAMQAFITKTDYFNPDITVSQIKDALLDRGVVMGIVEDTMIDGFIKSSGFKTKAFLVARGINPIEGRDAKIEFFFNTDYLKAGGVTEDGSIDFKDRGDVPHVEEGTVLAEKIPRVEARQGHSIFGDEIETTPGRDLQLKIGKGAKLSEDGCKALAAVKGFPKYSLAGQIFVHQEYTTDGDVDFETGHIQYDGNINIKGRVKSGFKVRGNDVQALELDGGEIDAQGNVRIAGGINEGTIYARGNVFAKFIHNSEITCMGSVTVEKEIVDSTIECSGECKAENGKLISSTVTAKMGVKAKNIGTEMAVPCTIRVAHDIFMEKELKTSQLKIDGLHHQIEKHEKKKEEYRQENLTLQKQITDLAHIQDRAQLDEREVRSTIATLENTGEDPQRVSELKLRADHLNLNAREAEEKLDACFDQAEKIEDLVEEENRRIDILDQQCDHLIEEKNNIVQWAKDNPGKAQVSVTGAIMPETLIKGKHSEKRIREVTHHARFFEALCSVEEGKTLNIYEIQVGHL